MRNFEAIGPAVAEMPSFAVTGSQSQNSKILYRQSEDGRGKGELSFLSGCSLEGG